MTAYGVFTLTLVIILVLTTIVSLCIIWCNRRYDKKKKEIKRRVKCAEKEYLELIGKAT